MRRSLLFESTIIVAEAILLVGVIQAQPSAQEKAAPPSQEAKPPVSLSPALPAMATSPTDPGKMAESAGAKTAGTAPVDVATFVLGAQDQITITMWNEPQFGGNYTIRPDGMISINLLGEIKAAGLTPLQLQDAINKVALTKLKNPLSSVNVVGVHSKHVFFDGEGIGQPGVMDLVTPVHLLEGISSRGGFKEFADKKHISILRDNKKYVFVNGNKKSPSVSYSDIISGKHPEANPLLQDGDHVIVN
jgi:polysaccharide export outer membrane protein